MVDYTEQLNQARTEEKESGKLKKMAKKAKSKILPESQIGDAEFAIIGMIAAVSDGLDYLGVDLLLFRLLDLCTAAILGLWCLFRLKKFPGARFASSFLIELIPFVGDFTPTWTIFVATTYAEQRGYLPKMDFLKKLKGSD